MLQSSSETIELVLSQAITRKSGESKENHNQSSVENNYLQWVLLAFDVTISNVFENILLWQERSVFSEDKFILIKSQFK